MNCRHCNRELRNTFVDLDYAPISNDMLRPEDLSASESYFPLKVFVCDSCFLVQVDEFKKHNEIFNNDYTYFSSVSKTWLKHTKDYVDMMMDRFDFEKDSVIVEIASNDGCLLKNFIEFGVEVIGIEPTANTAKEAEKNGVRTIVEFFSSDFAKSEFKDKNITADLIIGNNVLAHVPDINDFVKGMKISLSKNGIITMEFPHLLNLIEECQFDTIYHEHFSYLSLISVQKIFSKQGLELFDVQEVPTHGGSLRIFAKHMENPKHKVSENIELLIRKEIDAGLNDLRAYTGFQNRVDKIKYDALLFLLKQNQKNKKIIGYGAASKGNTFLNYTGIKGNDLINFVVDASKSKQGKFLPGSHIPVIDEKSIMDFKPDFVIILPWNLKDEISKQLNYIRQWDGKFIIFIPELIIF